MSETSENQGISRRIFLKALGAFTLSAGVAAAAGIKLNDGLPTQEDPNKKATATPRKKEISLSEEELLFNQNGIKVWFQDGIPTRWEDQNSQGGFDKEKLLDAKRQGEEDGGRKVAQVVRVTSDRITKTAISEIEPAIEGIKNLPKDVVSSEELSRRGIEVLDSQNVGFHIRHSAFEEGGLMEQYRLGGDRKLKILITDKPTILQENFQEERYASARDMIQKVLQTVTDAPMYLHACRAPGDDTKRQLYEQSLQLITKQEIIDWGLMGIAGYAIRAGMEEGSPDTDFLFLAMGKKTERPSSFECVQVIYTPDGWSDSGFSASLVDIPLQEAFEPTRILELHPDQSYTNPEEYTKLELYREGTFEWKVLAGVDPDSKDPYFVAMHELEHLKRSAKLGALAKEPQDNVERLRYFSEQDIDFTTWDNLKNAYDHYKQTGDDSRYPFVLENKRDGYYVIG